MKKMYSLTEGNILTSLIYFALPVLFALFLQALYGGVDLLIVGQFAKTADVSGVATGSMLMHTITMIITGLSMGITILVGQKIGEKHFVQAGRAIGGGIYLFIIFSIFLTLFLVFGAGIIAKLLHAPEEAFYQTVMYIRICGAGSIFIIAYNVLGSIFRGIGDSKTPLLTVIIACILNIFGDFIFVAIFHMGASGAALATIISQAVSVIISFVIIKNKTLPFNFSIKSIRFNKKIIKTELKLGTPIALQELLVGTSFLIIQTIVNSFGVVASAGVGVAEKVCMFIMLVPSAYMHSMSAFVAQNIGARNPQRAKKALLYGILTSISVGIFMGYAAFFHGDILSSIFAKDLNVVLASHDYLKAYAIDCLLTSILFCFIGYYNGCRKTMFVMIQGIIGAFCVRVPVAYLVSRISGVTLFHIGLATPCSTVIQIILCFIMFKHLENKNKSKS